MYHKTARPWEEQTWMASPKDGESKTVTVVEPERDNFSGLYDAHGNKLYKPQTRIGFIK